MKTIITVAFAAITSLAVLACAHAGSRDGTLDATTQAVDVVDVVNLNTASERDLDELPGIGPTKAAAIVAYRNKHGLFARVDDLNKVKGFGRKTVARLRPALRVDLPPQPVEANRSSP